MLCIININLSQFYAELNHRRRQISFLLFDERFNKHLKSRVYVIAIKRATRMKAFSTKWYANG